LRYSVASVSYPAFVHILVNSMRVVTPSAVSFAVIRELTPVKVKT